MILKRTGILIKPDSSRVFFRPFEPGNARRVQRILRRIDTLTEEEVTKGLDEVMGSFSSRHSRIEDYFLKRFHDLNLTHPVRKGYSIERQKLIGAYFTSEYSMEAAALFNPSMVWHPDQSGMGPGERRFIMSLRATGEGHISSIVFRTGVITDAGDIVMRTSSRFITSPQVVTNPRYHKITFESKLYELELLNTFSEEVMSMLDDPFDLEALEKAVKLTINFHRDGQAENTATGMVQLALNNYDLLFSEDLPLSARIIFPLGPNETNGIEDARFVEFREDDGTIKYYATYTAYNGRVTFPQLLETRDFLLMSISTLNGPEVQNKGMALFPRKINGQYAMISRQDGENIYIMFSDMIEFWHHKQLLLEPYYPWEMVQLGNCGSPIETDRGWLLLSHGVGPMRKYCISAILLDLEDPTKIIGRLPEPLLSPSETEREGYVPNVVYSCGGLVHGRTLILPYAMSDSASSIATCNLDELIDELLANPPHKPHE